MSRNGPTARLTSVIGSGTDTGRRALVVGGGHIGRTVASDISDTYDVTFLSRAMQVIERAERDGVVAHHVDKIESSTLDEVDARNASLAIVASEDDGTNLLVAQLLRTRFDVETVVIRVNDRDKLDSVDELDVETVCVPDLLVGEVAERLESVANNTTDT